MTQNSDFSILYETARKAIEGRMKVESPLLGVDAAGPLNVDQTVLNARAAKDQTLRDSLAGHPPLTASDIREMEKKARHASDHSMSMAPMPAHITNIWSEKLFSDLVKPGRVQVSHPNTIMEKLGPSVRSQLVEEEPVYVPVPNDAFPVQVAVTAKLDEVGMCVPRIIKQITEAVHVRRRSENMQARDLLETFVCYSDIGLNVRITTNATLSKAIVEATFADERPEGATAFVNGEMTYEQFEAYQSAVSGAKGR